MSRDIDTRGNRCLARIPRVPRDRFSRDRLSSCGQVLHDQFLQFPFQFFIRYVCRRQRSNGAVNGLPEVISRVHPGFVRSRVSPVFVMNPRIFGVRIAQYLHSGSMAVSWWRQGVKGLWSRVFIPEMERVGHGGPRVVFLREYSRLAVSNDRIVAFLRGVEFWRQSRAGVAESVDYSRQFRASAT